MKDFFYQQYLQNEAIRIAKKDDEKFDEMSEKDKQLMIELMMEDLEDKYRE